MTSTQQVEVGSPAAQLGQAPQPQAAAEHPRPAQDQGARDTLVTPRRSTLAAAEGLGSPDLVRPAAAAARPNFFSQSQRGVTPHQMAKIVRKLGIEYALVERAAHQLRRERRTDVIDAFSLEEKARQLRFERLLTQRTLAGYVAAAERGDYGLERVADPTPQDRTPVAARERLRRDSERYGWILRPAP